MDLQLFPLTTTVSLAAIIVLTAVMQRPLPKPGILLNLGALAVAGLAWLMIPNQAGGIAFAAWLVLFIIPGRSIAAPIPATGLAQADSAAWLAA